MSPLGPKRSSKRLPGQRKAVGHRIIEDQTDEARVKRQQLDEAGERIKKSTNMPHKDDKGTKLLDAGKSARSRAEVVTMWTCVRVFPQLLGCHSTPNCSSQIVLLQLYS